MFYGGYTTSNSGSDNGYEGEDDDSEENVVEVEQVEVIRSRRLRSSITYWESKSCTLTGWLWRLVLPYIVCIR